MARLNLSSSKEEFWDPASFQVLGTFRAWGGRGVVGDSDCLNGCDRQGLQHVTQSLRSSCFLCLHGSRDCVSWTYTALPLHDLPQTQPTERTVNLYRVVPRQVPSTSVWAHAVLLPGAQGSSLTDTMVFSILSPLISVSRLVCVFFFLTGSVFISWRVPSSVFTGDFWTVSQGFPSVELPLTLTWMQLLLECEETFVIFSFQLLLLIWPHRQ